MPRLSYEAGTLGQKLNQKYSLLLTARHGGRSGGEGMEEVTASGVLLLHTHETTG